MDFLIVLLEIGLVSFGCWTAAYHVSLLAGLPASCVGIPFLVLFGGMALFFCPKWRRIAPNAIRNARFLTIVGLTSVISGAFTLFSLRPDADDLDFFHRAVVQLEILNQPFLLGDTLHNMPGLPALSVLHVATSYEPLMAILAKLAGINPVWFYQNVGAFIAAAMLPVVYVLLYMEFGLPKKVAVGCALTALLFLLLDGNVHRSFGNVSLVRFWQGKTMLWSLLVPTAFFVGHRWLVGPTRRRFAVLVATCVSGVGLSNSAVFMLPVFFLGLAVAYLLIHGFSRRSAFLVATLNVPPLYCLALAASLKLGILPTPDTSVYQWPQADWMSGLYLVIGSHRVLIRNLFSLIVLPLVFLPTPLRFYPSALALSFVLLFANPLSGGFWIKELTPASYWRLAYLFPVPWCAGLVACALSSRGTSGGSLLIREAAAVAFAVAVAWAFQFPSARFDQLKAPWDYRFSRQELAFSLSVADRMDNRNLLAPAEIVQVLPLFNTTVRLETARPEATTLLFRTAGKEVEGRRRCLSQTVVAQGNSSDAATAAFLSSIGNGVDAVVAKRQSLSQVRALLETKRGQWDLVHISFDYVLFLKRRGLTNSFPYL